MMRKFLEFAALVISILAFGVAMYVLGFTEATNKCRELMKVCGI